MKNNILIPAIPFAIAPYIQDYLNFIQNYRYLKKDNKENIEKIIKKIRGYKMKLKNIVLIVTILSLFNGCYSKIPSYEAFVYNNNWNIGKSHIPSLNPNLREIYSEDKYIYIFKNSPRGCIYGFLTNRDDKPEKVIDWIIISGKEYCKEQREFGF